jgi:hypothetical protein
MRLGGVGRRGFILRLGWGGVCVVGIYIDWGGL